MLALSLPVIFAFAGCEPSPPVAPTVSEMPDAGRHPDGVLLETPAALPSAQVRAEARGVVALREPLGVEAVNEMVMALVNAIANEDLTTFESLLLADCVPLESGMTRGSRAPIVDRFRRRMRELDFSRLAGLELVRLDHVQHFESDELDAARDGRDLGRETARPPMMRAGDVYVRFPLEVTRVGNDRYFGDVWTLVLRRVEGTRRYKVAGFGESDNGSP